METRKYLFETKWKQFLAEQTQSVADYDLQEKLDVLRQALKLYNNRENLSNLNPYLEKDLKAIQRRYPIDKQENHWFAENVFDSYVDYPQGPNPLFLYIGKK